METELTPAVFFVWAVGGPVVAKVIWAGLKVGYRQADALSRRLLQKVKQEDIEMGRVEADQNEESPGPEGFSEVDINAPA
ncbi:hypothetical protein TWF730_005725 [Orbilia blumenaviensis]|uniref:Uncharacterized protein n=1 Tax=Orbilia blumenaviensis TaxID=1796055 RepID=A0AAV9VKL5_9PEZI